MRRVLIVGSGGREHAISWALRKTSQKPVQIFCVPGNAGIAELAETPSVAVNDHAALAEFVEAEGIDLTFVGPEAPLVAGIVDHFASRGLRIVGPTAAAARLRSEKLHRNRFRFSVCRVMLVSLNSPRLRVWP